LCEADFTSPDLLGTAFEYFLGRWAVKDRRDALLESYSPRGLVRLMVQLLDPQNGESIHDPVCGTGGMLLESYKHIRSVAGENSTCELSGQELVASTAMLSQWNHLFHGLQPTIEVGDTLLEPAYYDDRQGTHQQFDCVLGSIPFGVREWGREQWMMAGKALGRDQYGMPPRGRGEYAFIGHMIASMKRSTNGRMAVAVPIGVLFGTGSDIRKEMLEEDLIEAVIQLPGGLLPHTAAPLAVIIFRHEKPAERRGKVLFISAEDEYNDGERKRNLGPDNIEKIVQCYQSYELDPEETVGQEGQWAQQEIGASVEAYLKMLQEEVSGGQYNKAEVNRELREGVLNRRSRGSVEMRMCNISTVLRDAGKRFIDGYKPRENVGTNVYLRIQHALIQCGFPMNTDSMSYGLDQLRHHVVSVEEILGADSDFNPRRYVASESNLFFDEVRHLADNEHPELSLREVSRSSVMGDTLRIRMASGISCKLRWLDGRVTIQLRVLDEKLAHQMNHSPLEFHAVATPTKWNFDSERGKVSLSLVVSLTEDAEQKDWSVQKKANEALELYGRIKKFVLDRISADDGDGDGEENSDSLSG
jgi:type I restriction enzyme M protein